VSYCVALIYFHDKLLLSNSARQGRAGSPMERGNFFRAETNAVIVIVIAPGIKQMPFSGVKCQRVRCINTRQVSRTRKKRPRPLPIDAVRRKTPKEFAYRCKQGGQLASKMRFLSAPWLGLLETGAWLRNAQHANAMAERLEQGLRKINGISIMFPRQANSVFACLPPKALEKLHTLGWHFYTFIGVGGARFMCSWDIKESSVDALLADIRTVVEEAVNISK